MRAMALRGGASALLLAFFFTAAAAETRSATVRRNSATAVATFTVYNPEGCTAGDAADTHVSDQPAHGAVTMERQAVQLKSGRCAGRTVRGIVFIYRPKPGFAGRDAFTVALPMSPYEERLGGYQKITYEITVQ